MRRTFALLLAVLLIEVGVGLEVYSLSPSLLFAILAMAGLNFIFWGCVLLMIYL